MLKTDLHLTEASTVAPSKFAILVLVVLAQTISTPSPWLTRHRPRGDVKGDASPRPRLLSYLPTSTTSLIPRNLGWQPCLPMCTHLDLTVTNIIFLSSSSRVCQPDNGLQHHRSYSTAGDSVTMHRSLAPLPCTAHETSIDCCKVPSVSSHRRRRLRIGSRMYLHKRHVLGHDPRRFRHRSM